MSSGDEVIRLDSVRKEFGPFTAVHHADFGIGRGEFFALLGPSGCGKTTLLRMIAGFEEPTSGRILLDGMDQRGVPPHKRHVNTVFQQYALFPHMSVFDNVAFGPRARGMKDAQLRPQVNDILEVVRLADKAKRRPSQLSGGQQQRVALARALVNLPSALLLDEPLAALDLKLRQAMQIELKRIQREVGITFVFVTHDQEEALTMSDRIAVMSQGRVEQIGTPDEIYGAPSSVFVAGFIGTANLLPATFIQGNAASSTVDLATGQRVIGGGIEAKPGDPVTVMVRPERLHASVDAPAGTSLQGTVTDIIFQGATTRVVLRLADETEIIAHIGADERLPFLRQGDALWVSWGDEAVYLMRGWPTFAGATSTNVDQVQAQLDGVETVLDPDAPVEGPRAVSRRALLVGAGVLGVAAVAGVAAAIATSGDDADSTAGSTTAPDSTGPATTALNTTTAPVTTSDGPPPVGPEPGSTLRILNWPLYIENDDPPTSPTLLGFTDKTGVKVEYLADLNDNDEFYALAQPDLAAGRGIGFDIVIPTSWMAARMIEEGLVLPLEMGLMPNKVNIRADLASPTWDPTRQSSMPWAQGQTGIAYFPDKTGRALTSISDLLDPAFKNRVTILSEWRDTIGLFLLDAGVTPEEATMDQIRAAIAVIAAANDDGQFRKVTGNSYTEDLIIGESWAAIAWSGDIATIKASETPNIEYLLPEKGAMSFVDTCVVPVGADNAAAAAAFLDYIYDPAISGPLFESITYVSPVTDAAAFMTPAGQANPFVNPPPGARLHEFRPVTPDEETEIVQLFTEATQL